MAKQRFVVCSTVEQTCKIIIILSCDSEQEFSFSTFVARIKFPNLFLLFLLILKCFQKVFKKFLACFIVWYEMFTTSLQQFQFANQSMTFPTSLETSHRQVWSAIWTMDRVYVLQFTPGQTRKWGPSLKPFLDIKTHEMDRVFAL